VNVLIVGSGGREHAIAWKLRQSTGLAKLYCAPGNPGTASLAENVPIAVEDLEELLQFALSKGIELTVVGPEAPLALGIVDHFRQAGLAVVGPTRAAAELEASKVFAKEFMRRNGIPTAQYLVCTSPETAEAALKGGEFSFPVVTKADGLAAGKGVFICRDLPESLQSVSAIMRERQFGAAGDRIVIEEFLEGEEASFMVFSDGEAIVPMVPSQDHKALLEADQGPNTGGMGAYSIDAILSDSQRGQVLDKIIRPTIEGLKREGRPYQGVLYAGLMLTRQGPRVLEFNVRFGDPETQVVLPRLESDLLEVLDATAKGRLKEVSVRWNDRAVVCVVLASGGYPGVYSKGKEIKGLDMAGEVSDTLVFHAGTASHNGKIVSSGGRVLGVTAVGSSLEAAIMQAYEGVNKIHFDGVYCRRDIGVKGLRKIRN
jgi:phosphoribosylamine---glycine ligase